MPSRSAPFVGDDLAFATVGRVSKLLAARDLSPVELVRIYLERIDRLDPSLRSFITLRAEDALAEARTAEAEIASGNWRGPLHGIPYGAKDQIHTKSVRTTCGSLQLVDYIPLADAHVIQRMSHAGAILIGKQNMSEFAMGDAVQFPFGVPRNPWDLSRRPGSSSSGSAAATAAGFCAVSLAEDTGGSIRGPATYTGLVGLRPTWGRVSRHGVQGLCWSMDTIGPLARSAQDCAIVLSTIAGRDPRDWSTSARAVPDYASSLRTDLAGLRVGVVAERLYGSEDAIEPEILRSVMTALTVLRGLGATLLDVSIPLTQHSALISLLISMVDGTTIHRERMKVRLADYDHNVQVWLLTGSIIPAQTYYKAQRVRALIRQYVFEAFRDVDVLVLPTSSMPAPQITDRVGVRDKSEARARFTGGRNFFAPFNLAGVPAVSVPCGFTEAGLPIGLQVVGKPFQEGTVLHVAHAFETATEWRDRRPKLA